MTRKNSNIKHLINTLNSPKSTPNQIKNTFFKYFESTRDYYKRRLNNKVITHEEYENYDKLLDALKAQIKFMITKIIRLEGRINRLDNNDINFLTEINFLKKENHDLIKENETLKKENEAFKIVISHSAGIYRNNEEQYERTIQRQRNEINCYHQIFQVFASYCQENSIDCNIINSFLQLNEIDTRICYSSFNDAVNASNNLKKVELNQNETEIEESSHLHRTFSFIEIEENETIQDDEGECSKFVKGNNNFD
ncbi:472_t:CDS:2 [Dentiscutata erythropus]|uniref:472_t:CDS:1 n=1 Tax=Dentiscutata erythropus TaxID=1348616 RepID=A0A9N9FIE1_9GLOM|nr:472_t:CDS:2 [Dentiscutata erythropus]